MYTHHPGFFSLDGLRPIAEATEPTLRMQLYQSWTEFTNVAPTCYAEVLSEIRRLPHDCILLAGTGTLDRAVAALAAAERPDVHVRTIRAADIESETLSAWIRANKLKYFLMDAKIAAVLYFCEHELLNGKAVACIGPFPKVQDVTWMFDGEGRPTEPLEDQPRWCVTESAKTASAFLMQTKFQRFFPNLVLGCTIPFIASLKLDKLSTEYRQKGIFEFGSEHLGKFLNPGADFQPEDTALQAVLERSSAEVLRRPVVANRFYTRIKHYVG